MGVWFPDDPQQTPYHRFLDEVADSGYEWIELGPYGYLPTDPEKLLAELGSRGLKLSAGTVFEHLHQDDSWDAVWTQVEDVARLTAAVGGTHVVVIPEMWRDPSTGAVLEDRVLTPEQWRKKTEGMDQLGKAMFETYGVRAQYHPHADSHVDTEENVYRFLDGTDSEFVNLCLDTGHISYCGGDNIAIIRRAPERIGYLHLKQVDPEVRAKVEAEDLPFGEAVKLGAMTEPRAGSRTCLRFWPRSSTSASTCSRSSSRTCTPARSTPRCPSPSAPAPTSGPAASRPSPSVRSRPCPTCVSPSSASV